MGFAEREKKSFNKYWGGPGKKSINTYPGFFQNIFPLEEIGQKSTKLCIKKEIAPDF